MYYYIVDPQKISQREFERVQNNLYSSLSEFRIAGEVMRVTGLRSIQQLVENAFAHETKTIVAIGSDDTLHEVVNAIGKREMVVGFIPLGDSEMGEALGITNFAQAIKTIAGRRIEALDLGFVNDYYFLSRLSFGLANSNSIRDYLNLPPIDLRFAADGKYEAHQNILGGVILNCRPSKQSLTLPTDGSLDLVLLPPISNWNMIWQRSALLSQNFESIPQASVIHAKQFTILQPEGLAIKIGNRVVAKAPATITVMPGMLKMIVGRERSF